MIVQKYLHLAIELTLAESKELTKRTVQYEKYKTLSKNQKVVVTKIHKNLNVLCKMPKKQIKDILKTNPQYQEAIAELFFDKHINNTLYISGKNDKQKFNSALAHADNSSFQND